ncbi:uncharacterized protein LOC131679337 [Topomyia yanbarensis]|uniref:uncharacterized protein LOC131679337 n=1 Tax=Topomyia yanbarensis TaxID=2498891 RepID=UPI00273C02E8|nr:uncharacterized protein LOC131679337 [Topomyia yanbarensis]
MKPSSAKCVCVIGAITIISVVCGAAANLGARNQTGTHPDDPIDGARNRDKRSLFFPYNAAMGLLIAIAVPLSIPDRNIFVSYNFEGNYNSPQQSNIFTEGLFNFIRGIAPPLTSPVIAINRALQGNPAIEDATGVASSQEQPLETTTQSQEAMQQRAQRDLLSSYPRKFFTRKKIYHAIEEQMKKNGFNGKKCLLRAICEAAEIPMLENNGVVGDLVHIILSPSSSQDENLPAEFYKAEKLGIEGNCQKYYKYCKENILDTFSFMME